MTNSLKCVFWEAWLTSAVVLSWLSAFCGSPIVGSSRYEPSQVQVAWAECRTANGEVFFAALPTSTMSAMRTFGDGVLNMHTKQAGPCE